MYCYLYDEYIQENKRFERELLKIENRLTDLGIAGKVSRLALFRNAEEMIRDEIDHGVSTIVVVGNDETVRKVIDVVADNDVVLGIIPIGPGNELARMMGVPEGVEACEVLSARRVEKIDVGTVNGRRFITGVTMPNFRAEITCEDKFRVTSVARQAALEIRNLTDLTDPRDGQFEAVISAAVKTGWGIFGKTQIKESILPLSSMAIRSELPISLFVDGEEMKSTRFDIGIEPLLLKVITGKTRVF
ncbi:NAD(+)/NADH kinase [Candidatus Uhrbacteria bacterium]|nr:NAD(+)/NADH kinase [Candidatus Uhrbacteria bacterium]